jgi:hypothetical protein
MTDMDDVSLPGWSAGAYVRGSSVLQNVTSRMCSRATATMSSAQRPSRIRGPSKQSPQSPNATPDRPDPPASALPSWSAFPRPSTLQAVFSPQFRRGKRPQCPQRHLLSTLSGPGTVRGHLHPESSSTNPPANGALSVPRHRVLP